jgi:hypothetical protein
MTGVTEIRGDITAVSNAVPCVVTSTSHGLSNGDHVKITECGGMENFNNRVYRVDKVTTNTFELTHPDTRENFDSTDLETYTSGGRWNKVNRVNTDRVFYNA